MLDLSNQGLKYLPESICSLKSIQKPFWSSDKKGININNNSLCDEFYYSNVKIDTSIDWWMNLMIDKYKLKVYWAEPTIIETNKYVSAFDIV